VTPPDHDEDHPPFLKRPVGYGTMGGLLGCLTFIIIWIVLGFLIAYFGPGKPLGLVVWASTG
jgi:hypothetical protein